MKIGFDLDGVILDHTEAKIAAAHKRGYRILPEQTPSDMLKTLLPQALYRELQAEIYNSDTALSAPLMDGVRGCLENFRDHALRIHLISRRLHPHYAIAALERHGLWPSFFNDANACFVETKEAKAQEAAQRKLTHFFDDEIGVLACMAAVPERILFDQYAIRADSPFPIVSSWEALAEMFGIRA